MRPRSKAHRNFSSPRAQNRLPVLRKDFMLDPYNSRARAWGADAILLSWHGRRRHRCRVDRGRTARSMDTLVEVHDLVELERASRSRGHDRHQQPRFETFATQIDVTCAWRRSFRRTSSSLPKASVRREDLAAGERRLTTS